MFTLLYMSVLGSSLDLVDKSELEMRMDVYSFNSKHLDVLTSYVSDLIADTPLYIY